MALPRDYRFPVPFEDAFPQGALIVGDVEPAYERQSQEDRSRGRTPRQRVDAAAGLPVWQVTVSDPAPARRQDSSITVEILAGEQPELPDTVPGIPMEVRQVEFEGLMVQPRLGGTGEIRWLTYAYRASGVRAAGSAAETRSGGTRSGSTASAGSGSSSASSAGESGSTGGGR